MRIPLSLFIGWRYTRAKRRNQFISFISLASLLGIALGMTVLITVLSVMNGFDQQIRMRFFALIPQVTVFSGVDQSVDSVKAIQPIVLKIPSVVSLSPYVAGNGMLMERGSFNGLQLLGIDPGEETKTSKIASKIKIGQLSSLQPGSYHAILGETLANQLGIRYGDTINIFTPQLNLTLAGVFPRHRQFKVTGIFHTSDGFGFDASMVYVNIDDAANLLKGGQGTRGYHVKLTDIYQAESVTHQLQRQLPPGFIVGNWTQQAGALFSALQMEKTMMFVILLLIIAVAIFNLVSTLVMVVNDKRSDIAILRTIGATPSMIMRTFICQGAIVGLMGTVIGILGGVILSLNITALTNWIQKVLGIQLISSKVYWVDYLPSVLQMNDVIHVAVLAFGLSILATIYPAWMAFKTQPAEALRYE
ncbi:MAG: lipoprotein-releasing system transmembrane subunit LolC [Coxiellaceae bacterium]|nr:lipoprotein-releasing system transmembrane subunit LolC [Coxiellaceae bacterium]|tara:strand:+ start:537 stop:1790 length:1254 start_codon:yes stop_codon:yes gene_type:complete